MFKHAKSRNAAALVVSGAVHVAFALTLLSFPEKVAKRYDIVDMTVFEPPKPVEKPPMVEPKEVDTPAAPEPAAAPEEPKRKKVKKAKPKVAKADEPPPPPQPVEAKPEPATPKPEAPPVFDLGDNSFATGNGPGASWELTRSEGNTRFAGVAKQNQGSVRGTKVATAPKQTPRREGSGTGGGGDAPVPLKNLSRRPMPKNGPVSPPPYPAEAKKAGVEGPVVLKVFIDRRGRVKKTQVVTAPHTLLAKAAQTAMGEIQWTSPLDKRGNPVDTVIVWKFRFVLDG